ncbi:alpha/beta hydrolase [Streptococcus sp. HF-1907]|uniref:alpha/beta hydrolase n=1 Tax=Streptococcus sp. HF-1907 TaxID=2785793 RepID=UPI0018A0C1A0|nr:alpha/beta hydrolase [Streptococcus sp. HF-1907]MBF7094859.1 alpha/beta hydrolase [Streptococcus sp. HF-1907]
MKKLKAIPFVIAALVLIGMTLSGKSYVHKINDHQIKINSSRMNPTILVPGSSATQERFDSMLESLNNMGHKHSILKLTVKTDNSIRYSGQITNNDLRPFIVIAFENNHDGYANIKKQTAWLNIAMNALQKKYKFKNFNAIGHSNGGLNWTIFLEKYYDSDDFNIQTLMTIGTPYNFEETNTENRTQMLKDLIANRDNISSTLTMYSLAGTSTYDADKIVPFASVEAGKYIYQNTAKHYTQLTVTGSDADHSDLPSNTEVVQYIADKVLKINNRRQDRKPQ